MRDNRQRHRINEPSDGVFLLWLVVLASLPFWTALVMR